MARDKVIHPPQSNSRSAATSAKQVKSGMIEGPMASSSNLNAYNRSSKGKGK